MSETNAIQGELKDVVQPEAGLPPNYQVGTITTAARPEEMCFPLMIEEFRILSDCESGAERAGRDLHLGLCIGSITGLVGLIATVDWDRIWTDRNWRFLAASLVLFSIASATAVGCAIHWGRMTKEDTPCSRLKEKISAFFRSLESRNSPEAKG